MTILQHIHLTPSPTTYTHAANLQSRLVAQFLAHKASPQAIPAPSPTLITAQFHPVYTCGRREIGTVTHEQKRYLTSPTPWGKAEFHEALRGGQTTFHGPGQLVAYPIIDLRRHNLSARCYIRYLENTIIDVLKSEYGLSGRTTANPGVWLGEGREERKICAIGVHLRRNITSHGIGLNVSTELGWFGRIMACGLEGKGTTSLEKEGVSSEELEIKKVGGKFAMRFAEGLEGVEAVVSIDEAALD